MPDLSNLEELSQTMDMYDPIENEMIEVPLAKLKYVSEGIGYPDSGTVTAICHTMYEMLKEKPADGPSH